MTTTRAARLGWLAAAAALAAGCGDSRPTGSLAGTVTYKGNPVQAGSLNLLSRTGAAAQEKLDESGAFKVDGPVEAGEYAAYLGPPVPEPQAPGARRAAPPKFDVPPKYQDPATSGVTVVVKAGTNTVPVEFR
jgi:hypothetical protein